jgi:hypothetical protein
MNGFTLYIIGMPSEFRPSLTGAGRSAKPIA